MSTQPTEPIREQPPEDRLIYWIIGGVVVVLMVIGLFAYTGENDSAEAQDKAQQLTQKLEAAGLRAPVDQDVLTRTLGTDGGPVCDNPASALGKALLLDQLGNGGAFVGRRPVIVDRRVLAGEALILQTYCPEKLEKFKDKFDDLKFDDVIKG